MAQAPVNPTRRIYDVLRHQKSEIWAIYFYAILNGLVALSLPLGIQAIVSFLMAGTISASLILLIILVVAGVFVAGLLQVNQKKIIEKIQQQLFVRYSFQYAHALPRLSLRETSGYYLPELVNRFFDTVSLQKGMAKLLLDIPAATIQIIFGLLLLCFYHPVFIFFGLLLLSVLYLILRITSNRGLQTSIEESDYKYQVAGYLEELARTVTSFKFYRKNGLHLRRTDELVSRYLGSRTAHFRILLAQYWTLIGFKVLITAAMLIVGATLLVQQKLNIGQFIAAEIVILTVISSVEKFITSLENVYDVITSAEKVNKVIEKPHEQSGSLSPEPSSKGFTIQANNLGFAYAGEAPTLRGLSFEIRPGEKVCVQGSPGSGKSTLLRVLSGSFQPYSGTLTLDGIPLSQYNTDALSETLGVLLASGDVFEGTVWDNITMGADRVSHVEVQRLAGIVGLTSFLECQPQGFQTLVHAAGQHLSPRTTRKILLMRVLLHKPRLLLLEQPWLYLDLQDTSSIQNYILREMPQTTAVIISSDPDFARQCDRVLMMHDGIANSFSTPQKLAS